MLKKIEELKNQKKKHHLLIIKINQEFKSVFCSRSRTMFTLFDALFDILPAVLPAVPPVVLFVVPFVARFANVFPNSPMKKNDFRKYVK